jgi:carboxyl-terminal processing protease
MENKQNNPMSSMSKILGISIVVVFAFVFGIIAGRVVDLESLSFFESRKSLEFVGNVDGEQIQEKDFDLYWEVWEMMRDEYVDASVVDESEMFYGSIKGMVNSFGDSATIFLDPEETQTFNDNSAGNFFSGIGAELGYNQGSVVVISPIEGSPAKAAGIRAGDVIVKIDGEEVKNNENIYDVVAKVRGEEGTDVTLTVLHRGSSEFEDITVTRGQITVPSMSYDTEDDGNVAVIDVSRFTDGSLPEWKANWDEMVDKVVDSGVDKLIIDLRGNPGGYFDAAVYAAGEFLDEGTIVSLQEDKNGKRNEFKVNREGRLKDIEVVVLVNEGSASASEILSGALQGHSRAMVIGVNTYGKGTAQSVVSLSDGSSLHITVLKWLLPDGSWLNRDNPIKPDIEVDLTEDDFKDGIDPQMDRAIEELN